MDNVIFRGTLTKGKFVELFEAKNSPFKFANSSEFNPIQNPNAISLIKQDDGNWKGFMQKFGKMIEVREAKPEDALVKLLTHG